LAWGGWVGGVGGGGSRTSRTGVMTTRAGVGWPTQQQPPAPHRACIHPPHSVTAGHAPASSESRSSTGGRGRACMGWVCAGHALWLPAEQPPKHAPWPGRPHSLPQPSPPPAPSPRQRPYAKHEPHKEVAVAEVESGGRGARAEGWGWWGRVGGGVAGTPSSPQTSQTKKQADSRPRRSPRPCLMQTPRCLLRWTWELLHTCKRWKKTCISRDLRPARSCRHWGAGASRQPHPTNERFGFGAPVSVRRCTLAANLAPKIGNVPLDLPNHHKFHHVRPGRTACLDGGPRRCPCRRANTSK
jgi:hypothetical protein